MVLEIDIPGLVYTFIIDKSLAKLADLFEAPILNVGQIGFMERSRG